MTNNKGFTFLELMISMSIVAIIAVTAYSTNLFNQIKKGRDNKRKQEVTTLIKIMESYYNDHESYPTLAAGTIDGLNCTANPQGLKPYIEQIPCDPQYPNHTYLYTSDDNTFQKIRLYVQMENPQDSDVTQNPCGTPPNYCPINTSQGQKTFNYVITSTNVDISTPLPPSGAVIP